MKSSYELAMERLNKTAPSVKLTAAQKAEIAELESRNKAKIAALELSTRDEIAQAAAAGDSDKVAELQERLGTERKKSQAGLEEQKEAVRRGKR